MTSCHSGAHKFREQGNLKASSHFCDSFEDNIMSEHISFSQYIFVSTKVESEQRILSQWCCQPHSPSLWNILRMGLQAFFQGCCDRQIPRHGESHPGEPARARVSLLVDREILCTFMLNWCGWCSKSRALWPRPPGWEQWCPRILLTRLSFLTGCGSGSVSLNGFNFPLQCC